MSATYSNLPPGCTQAALDFALAAYCDEPEPTEAELHAQYLDQIEQTAPENLFCYCEEDNLCPACLAEMHEAAKPLPAGRPVILEETGAPLMYADNIEDELLIDAAISDRLMQRPICGAKAQTVPVPAPARKGPMSSAVVSIGNGLYARTQRRK